MNRRHWQRRAMAATVAGLVSVGLGGGSITGIAIPTTPIRTPPIFYTGGAESQRLLIKASINPKNRYNFKITYPNISIYNGQVNTYGNLKGNTVWINDNTCDSQYGVTLSLYYFVVNCSEGTTSKIMTFINIKDGSEIANFRGFVVYVNSKYLYYFDSISDAWPIRIYRIDSIKPNTTKEELIFSVYPSKLPDSCQGYGEDEKQGAVQFIDSQNGILHFGGKLASCKYQIFIDLTGNITKVITGEK